jgi:hypothetical protein
MLAKKRGWRGPSTRFLQLEMQMTPHLLVSERLSNGAEKDANNLLYSNCLIHTKCCCTCRRLEILLDNCTQSLSNTDNLALFKPPKSYSLPSVNSSYIRFSRSAGQSPCLSLRSL